MGLAHSEDSDHPVMLNSLCCQSEDTGSLAIHRVPFENSMRRLIRVWAHVPRYEGTLSCPGLTAMILPKLLDKLNFHKESRPDGFESWGTEGFSDSILTLKMASDTTFGIVPLQYGNSIWPSILFNHFIPADQYRYLCKQRRFKWDGRLIRSNTVCHSDEPSHLDLHCFAALFLIFWLKPYLQHWMCPNSEMEESMSGNSGLKELWQCWRRRRE